MSEQSSNNGFWKGVWASVVANKISAMLVFGTGLAVGGSGGIAADRTVVRDPCPITICPEPIADCVPCDNQLAVLQAQVDSLTAVVRDMETNQ